MVALFLNPLFRVLVHTRGMKRTVAVAQRMGGSREVTSSPDALLHARDVVLGVRAAAGALPIELVCLPRSFTSWTLLKRRGVPVSLLIGMDVRKPEKTAHAWVEVEGEAVGEVPSHIESLAVFEDAILVS